MSILIRYTSLYTFVSFQILFAGCGGNTLEDYTKESTFQGVEGQIFHLNKGCGNPFHDAEQYPDDEAWVVAFIGTERDSRANADGDGKFELPLNPGFYNIKVYPSESFIDDKLDNVQIADKSGIRIRRSYQNYFWPWQLGISFHPSVTREKINTILEENSLIDVYSNYEDEFIYYKVETPTNIHIQEIQDVLETNYNEVKSTSHIPYSCAQ